MRPLHDEVGARRRQSRYVLGELLGRGGMAEVFAGSSMGSHGFQKPCAIKRLLPELANDHVFVERLIGEAKLLVGMQHGNIVSVLDLARDGDDVFLVMEFVDGPSLRQLLKARGPRGIPLSVATYVVQSAAAGLEFAHNRSVIHADISPSNLLLTSSGEVRVADFGIARREGNRAGVVEGKWAYMAPEQARGEPLTPRSDVFALGVVLYELITGQHPLGRQITADEREDQIRIVPPRVHKPSVPPGIEAICMRMLAHDPQQRYARMQQLIDALVDERFANGWREGASDLATAIREIRPGGPAPQPALASDRGMTIVTRSLISAPHRASSPQLAEATPSLARGSAPYVDRTVVETPNLSTELPRPRNRTMMIFGAATVLGVIAAVVIQLAPSGSVAQAAQPSPSPVRTEPAVVPATVVVPIAVPEAAKPAAMPTPTPTPTPAPAPVASHRAPAKKAAVADATLRVHTEDGVWAYVSVGSDRQEAPARFKLASGSYTVKLRNTDLGLTRTCQVTLEPGKTRTLEVAMEEGGCDSH